MTARKHFTSRSQAAAFALIKKTQGFNVGALKLPIRGQREWIVFWSHSFLRPMRSKRA